MKNNELILSLHANRSWVDTVEKEIFCVKKWMDLNGKLDVWLLFWTGGMLICLPREQAAAYCKDIEKTEGYQAWIIGIVEKGNRTARIIDKPRVIEVPAKEKDGELW